MTQLEEDRIETFRQFIVNGKTFFEQLKNFYNSEYLLNVEDIYDIKENIVGLKYLYKSYILELRYLEDERLGQIAVYETINGTHFLAEPKFQIKESSQLYYDYPGNIFIGSKKAAYYQPGKSAEVIIREIAK